MSDVYELIDTQFSGNAWKVRLLCGFLNISLNRYPKSIIDGDLNNIAIIEKNPLQQIPILKKKDGQWLAESGAILWYLAQGTRYLPDDKQADIVYWLLFEQLEHMPNFAQPRLQISLRKIKEVNDPSMVAYRKAGHIALRIMEEVLSKRKFLTGESITIADIALYPYTRMADQGGYELTSFPKILAWMRNIENENGYVDIYQV